MKRLKALIAVFALVFLTSCSASGINTQNKIISPENRVTPLSGVWKVERYSQGNSSKIGEEVPQWIGMCAAFRKDAAAVGDDLCSDPVYKIKNVNTADYLLYQYNITPDYLGVESQEAQVITITSKNNFYYEFIKISDEEALSYIDGTFLYFKRSTASSDEVDSIIAESRYNAENYKSESTAKMSGLLLGIRSCRKLPGSSEKVWDYSTLWISSEDGKIKPILEADGLFVPRKSGFWKIGVRYDYPFGWLFAYPAGREEQKNDFIPPAADSKSVRTILYVGNDYISTECTVFSGNSPSKSIYQVIPIDNAENPKAVKISDISGPAGRRALMDGASDAVIPDVDGKNNYEKYNEENFALTRRNGHWIMKGRLNCADDNSDAYIDYNIKAIPPSTLVVYDNLAISWNEIKLRVPDALDAYTSPEKDFAVIITGNSILCYSINNGSLGDKPLRKIKLKDRDNVVMAEWALGRYTEKWDKEFKNNNSYKVNSSN